MAPMDRNHQTMIAWKIGVITESDTIVEDCLICDRQYGVRFMTDISDGDSSVYSRIVKSVVV